jgi:hypothetical protein
MEIRNASHRLTVENADLSGSSFQDVKLAQGTYRNCDQSQSKFEDITLRGSTLHNVDLTGVEIHDCNLSGMKIDGVLIADALEAYRRTRPAPAATTDGSPEIRPFRQKDEAAVIALWKSVFGYSAPHNDPATVIRQKLAVDPELFVVAVKSNEIAGTIIGGYDGHRGWIYSLAVDPRHRREGIGSSLVRHVERSLAARGCLKVNLQIFVSNAEVVRFYEGLGFRVEERISMGKLL